MSRSKDYLVFSSVLLVTLLSCAGVALPYPVLAPLFMDGQVNGMNSAFGWSAELLLGCAIAVYPLGSVIGSVFIGALSDSYGRRKVLIQTLLGGFIGYLLAAWAIMNEQYLLFVIARFFTGLCEGNAAIARAIALDLSKTIDKTRAMSLVSAASFLGWLVGPLTGGYLAEFGPEVAFWAGGGALLICTLFVWLVIAETHSVVNDKSFATLLRSHNSLHLLRQPIIARIFIFQLLFTLGLNAFYEFYPVWLVTYRDFGPSDIGHITALMTICMTLTSVFLVTQLKRILGIQNALLTGMFSAACCFAILPATQGPLMLLVFCLSGVSIAVYNGLLMVYVSDINQTLGHGALMGLITLIFFISSTLIAVVGSLVLLLDSALPLTLGSTLILLASLLLTRFIYARERLQAVAE